MANGDKRTGPEFPARLEGSGLANVFGTAGKWLGADRDPIQIPLAPAGNFLNDAISLLLARSPGRSLMQGLQSWETPRQERERIASRSESQRTMLLPKTKNLQFSDSSATEIRDPSTTRTLFGLDETEPTGRAFPRMPAAPRGTQTPEERAEGPWTEQDWRLPPPSQRKISPPIPTRLEILQGKAADGTMTAGEATEYEALLQAEENLKYRTFDERMSALDRASTTADIAADLRSTEGVSARDLSEEARQYDITNAESVRQYNATHSENIRQFNATERRRIDEFAKEFGLDSRELGLSVAKEDARQRERAEDRASQERSAMLRGSIFSALFPDLNMPEGLSSTGITQDTFALLTALAEGRAERASRPPLLSSTFFG
jgi:hypothetical protein